MHLVELIQDTVVCPHLLCLHIERLGTHSSDGPLLISLLHGIPQVQNLHHGEDNVLVHGEAPLCELQRGHRGVELD